MSHVVSAHTQTEISNIHKLFGIMDGGLIGTKAAKLARIDLNGPRCRTYHFQIDVSIRITRLRILIVHGQLDKNGFNVYVICIC